MVMQMIVILFILVKLSVASVKQVEDPLSISAETQVYLEEIYRPTIQTIKSLTSFVGIEVVTDSQSVVSVDDFGAVGDGMTDDTEAFEDAWNEACSSVFPIFYVPQGGTYLVRHTNFSGPCQSPLTVQIFGTIIAPEDPNDWEESQTSRWLLFNGVNNLVLRGGGIIDGRGNEWWAQSCKINKTNPCRPAPTAIVFESITNLWVRNLVVINSPKFHVTFENCVGVEVNNQVVKAPEHSPNTDGLHISASKYVVIKNSMIGTGDDCISIVSNSFDISIRNVTCGPGHGISIGSLGKANSDSEVSNVMVDGAYIHDTTNGLRIKTWQGGSGYAEGIKFQNVYMLNVSHPIIINQYYCDSPEPCPNQTSAVRVSEVSYSSIIGTSATTEAIRLACSQSVSCDNIVLQNIYLTLTSGDTPTSYCENAMVSTMGLVFPPPCSSSSTIAKVVNSLSENEE